MSRQPSSFQGLNFVYYILLNRCENGNKIEELKIDLMGTKISLVFPVYIIAVNNIKITDLTLSMTELFTYIIRAYIT